MRLDKYLKVSRLIKRRSTAKEVASNARISVNGKIVKPSYNLSIGDIIEVKMGNKLITVRVLLLNEFSKKDDASLMYELIDEKKIENTILYE